MTKKKKRVAVPYDAKLSDQLSTRHYLHGLIKEEVQAKEKAIYDVYPVMGYSTYTDMPVQKHENGYWHCVVSHYNSCD